MVERVTPAAVVKVVELQMDKIHGIQIAVGYEAKADRGALGVKTLLLVLVVVGLALLDLLVVMVVRQLMVAKVTLGQVSAPHGEAAEAADLMIIHLDLNNLVGDAIPLGTIPMVTGMQVLEQVEVLLATCRTLL